MGKGLKSQQEVCDKKETLWVAQLNEFGLNPEPSSTGGMSVRLALELQTCCNARPAWTVRAYLPRYSGTRAPRLEAAMRAVSLPLAGGRAELGGERGRAGGGIGSNLHCWILTMWPDPEVLVSAPAK